jgi:O-antigen ligase
MTAWAQSLKSHTLRAIQYALMGLSKLRLPLIAIGVLGLGAFFGWLIISGALRDPSAPLDQGELVVSILVVIALFAIVMRQPLNGLLIWVFFLPFLESYINIPMGKGIPDLSFSRFLIAFMSIAILAKGAAGKFRLSKISLTDVFVVLATAGLIMTASQSIDPRPTGVVQMTLSWHFSPMASYFFAKNLVRSKRDLKRLLWVIALLGALSGLYAIYELTTGNVLFLSKGRTAEDYDLYRGSSIRMIRGIWGATGSMGRAVALTIPITFYLWIEAPKGQPSRLILLLMLGFEAAGLLIAMSRTPWYSTMIALFIMQFFYPKFRKVFLILLCVAAVLLWATWDQVAESQVAERVNDKVSTLEGRSTRWETGLNMWWARPLRGWGYGRYAQESGRFRTDGIRKNIIAVENDYLHMLVAAGVLAFVPYLVFLIAPLVQSIRLFFLTRSPEWAELTRRGAVFIQSDTIAVYWAVLTIFAMCAYTALVTSSGIKMIPFSVAGAVIGSHEHLLGIPQLGARQRQGVTMQG